MNDLLTTSEVADLVGLTDARIRQLIYAKILPSIKIGNMNLVNRADIKLLENRKHGRPKKSAA